MAVARRRWVAGVLLVALGQALSPGAVPVYDGLGNPDEPYRFVSPPPGTEGRPTPSSAHGTASGGRALDVATREVAPQFRLHVPPGTQGTVSVTVEPEAPRERVEGRIVNGNVYDVTLTGQVSGAAVVTMRATSPLQPGPTLYHQGTAWSALVTSRVGQDLYSAPFAGPGRYALAFPQQAREAKAARHSPWWVLLAGVLGLAVVGVAVRVHTTRRSPVR